MMRHFVLTMTGSAQKLSEALPGGTAAAGGVYDRSIRAATVQAGVGNAAPAYIGGVETGVPTSSVYGQRIPAAVSGEPPAPSPLMGVFVLGATRLSDLYVLGANTEKLHLLVDFY